MTEKEFNKKIYQLIESIRKEATLFADDTKYKQRKRLEKAKKDIYFFAETYFPHYIKAPFGSPQRKMHRSTEQDGKITAIAGFRGVGKTTFLAIIKPVWKALFEHIHFNCKVARNRDLSKERTEAIRCEFLFNKRIVHDFGEQLTESNPGEETDFIIKSGCRFLALGYKSGIRGKVHGSYRPDYIDIDDLEDHQVFNERIADDKLKFVLEECYGALYKGKGTVVWLGNLTHQKSAFHKFKELCEKDKLEQREFIVIKADDGDFNPVWKENYTRDDLLNIRNAMGRIGYERHMRMNPIIEGAIFKAVWFKFGNDPGPKKIVTYCDPSLGEAKTSDYKAIITIGWQNPKYHVLDCWIRKATITQMLEKLYALDQQFSTRIYMESNFWQKILWEFIPQIAESKGYTLPVSGIENKEKKILRIEKLQPLFEWGWIVFPTRTDKDIQLLQDQLLGFPNYPNDDGPDALTGAISILKKYGIKKEYKTAQTRLAVRFSDLW